MCPSPMWHHSQNKKALTPLAPSICLKLGNLKQKHKTKKKKRTQEQDYVEECQKRQNSWQTHVRNGPGKQEYLEIANEIKGDNMKAKAIK